MDDKLLEETLRKEVQKIDKSVKVVAVEQSKKKGFLPGNPPKRWKIKQRRTEKGYHKKIPFPGRQGQGSEKGAGKGGQPFEHKL